jgi:hypothetical protein
MSQLLKRITLSFSIAILAAVTSLACTLATPFSSSTTSTSTWSILSLTSREDVLYTGEQRLLSFQASNAHDLVLLSLEARIDWHQLAGSAGIMELLVNGAPVTSEFLINKPITFTYADGRSFSYYRKLESDPDTSYWLLSYSPDYESNNVPGSGYQVLEGQAYLYIFDITELVNPGQVNTITLINQGEEVRDYWDKPVPLAFRQVRLLTLQRE